MQIKYMKITTRNIKKKDILRSKGGKRKRQNYGKKER